MLPSAKKIHAAIEEEENSFSSNLNHVKTLQSTALAYRTHQREDQLLKERWNGWTSIDFLEHNLSQPFSSLFP